MMPPEQIPRKGARLREHMTETASRGEYFPYSLQVKKEFWEKFSLGKLHNDIASSGKPRIIFYRELASKLNQGGKAVLSGELNLYSIQLKIQRHIVREYLEKQCPDLLPSLLELSGVPIGSQGLSALVSSFCRIFPGTPFIDDPLLDPNVWLGSPEDSAPRLNTVLGEILLLSVAASNRAVESFRKLIDWKELILSSSCGEVAGGMERFLATAPPVAMLGLSLPELLRLPQKAAPDSLFEQLKFMKEHWQGIIPEELLPEISIAFALMEEEGRLFMGHGDSPGAPVLEFGSFPGAPGSNDYYPEHEQFSSDTDWMPNVVLLAKMVYVWLGQLSLKYGEEITRLDQIPDAELDLLSRWGVTGLWLIGLWERSPASQKIKQICGNPEAISSAYSLFDYTIAHDLGGEEAFWKLREKALKRGIRLASDMVPNHMGLFSKWIVEHPDWFVQLDYPPYPAYRYTGVDLSYSSDISLHIEDGYWERRDAAVVFKHYDHRSGRTRFIYHGNDGSSTPWNDTAQLDYLNPEVREAVIGTILHVARMFPIIRFDAAMTLAKKHYQRLWFPQPGHQGVPSRAEQGMSREQFDRAMPEEFWRQVVDRVAAEVPDTLLLAEAFWLMEGYFVRTLGMHRVYNSAFMNMLKMEENAKYRQTVKNVLEFNPQVLQRFVNFMNNPDEKTAVEQFGKESKYIGACVLLVTMPGLPMLGHGQVEGLHEKYGMEYKKAYWDEKADEHLVREHERRIFPLMRRRWLFSGADNFTFYDFHVGTHVNEDVFAFSNRSGDQRAIVIYHNRFASTSGWITSSTSIATKSASGATELRRTSLGRALGFKGDGRHYYIFRDYADGMEYIRNGRELYEQGVHISLGPYDYHVLLDFREIWDDEYGTWGKLCHQLGDRPAAEMDDEVKQIRFASLIDTFRQHIEHSVSLLAGDFKGLTSPDLMVLKEKFALGQLGFLAALARTADLSVVAVALNPAVMSELEYLESVAAKDGTILDGETARRLAFTWLTLHRVVELAGEDSAESSAEIVQRFGLSRPLEEELSGEAAAEGDILAKLDVISVMALFRLLLSWEQLMNLPEEEQSELLPKLLADRDVAIFIGLHHSGGQTWFVKERWETMLEWLEFVADVAYTGDSAMAERVKSEGRSFLVRAGEVSGYRVDRLLKVVEC
jgi:glycosidase